MKAVWKGQLLAESNETRVVEGNHYFPENSLVKEHFKPSETKSQCPWKGTAHYYTLEVSGEKNKDAAWYYPDPKPAASEIAGHVAFWKGVEVGE
jgi:uncharacterized protein (DUF427 family)